MHERQFLPSRAADSTPDPSSGEVPRFVELLTRHQSRLYAFIYTLMPDADLAGDILQETNMVLWRKAAEFDHTTEFVPWAFAIARFQIRAARQRIGRDRHVFDETAFDRVAVNATRRAERLPERQLALTECLRRLTEDQRHLIRRRYEEGDAPDRIAAALGQTPNAVGVALYRVRQALARCVEGRLAQETAS